MEHKSMDTNCWLPKPEVWGGVECTINRVQDLYKDQLSYAGHYERSGDIEQFAALGIKKIRYPILWELHQPVQNKLIDWKWITRQLETIRENDIVPIAGLIHHGSGPSYTSLNDPGFAKKLAKYAEAVAKQFPWLEYYTPVNEPLTTARFSGLYGLWYPHQRNEKAFFEMLLNQLKGVVLSMRAIRKINSSAKLVQTEDLAKTHSTPLLAYQAKFENERRWLTYDLLCGRVDPGHFFWNYLISMGIAQEKLEFFLENKCAPEILGFNYYVTSERYLDEKIENYHPGTHGGNYQHVYADTEAVRVIQPEGVGNLLKEAWERFKLPMAITENHLSCTREEQMRWLNETWNACCKLRKENVDVRALTVWSLLGAYDWNSLLTQQNRFYESGVFTINKNKIRRTALANMVQGISTTGNYDHFVLNTKGWWNKNDSKKFDVMKKNSHILIIGRNGTLGSAFIKACEHRSIPFIALSRKELDISKELEVAQFLKEYKPWGIINAAGYVNVDNAETNSDECFSINTFAPELLARLSKKHGIRFMAFSSDLVFDGTKKTPYNEGDNVKPLSIYGISKAKCEQLVKEANPESLIIRSSAFFGPWDQYNFVHNIIDRLRSNLECKVVNDVIVSPTYVPDLANAALDLFIDEETGIWHISNGGKVTWADFANAVADRAGFKKHKLLFKPLSEMNWKAKRPLYSALESDRGIQLPALDNALERYFEQKAV
jgi:dTDP-4-dehydrorhamnose reductase